jgi:hypothetical protein
MREGGDLAENSCREIAVICSVVAQSSMNSVPLMLNGARVLSAHRVPDPTNATATTIVKSEIGRRNANDTKFTRAASRRLSVLLARFQLLLPHLGNTISTLRVR